MAYALVGTAGTVSTGTAGAAVTPAYGAGASRTANNLLVLQVVSTGSATLPAAISGWSIAKQQAGTSCSASIYYKIAAGADAAPAVPLVASAIHNARLLEFSGGVTATPLDQSAGVAGTTTPLVATAAGVDVGIGDLVIGSGGAINSAARTNTMTHTINNAASDVETSNGATSTASHYDFTYGFTTTKAAANSDSFAFQTTQLTGAVIALASFKIPVTVFTDSGSGTGTLSGSSVESYGFFFNDSRSGTIAAGAAGSHGATTPYDAVIDADTPVSHWKLGDASTAFDRWRVADLNPGGTIPATTGLLQTNGTDGASQFDVTTGWFARTTSADSGLPYNNTSAWTMEAWARVDVMPSGTATIFARGTSNPSSIVVGASGISSVFNDGTSAFFGTLVAAASLVLGRTYHLVQTWDGTNQRRYVDGVLVGTNARSGSKSFPDSVPNIGGINSGTGSVVVDEAAWYNTALSDARVLAHYTAGTTALSALTDTFDTTLDTAKWTKFGAAGSVAVSGGRLQLSYTSIGPYSGALTKNTYSIADSGAFVQAYPFTSTTGAETNFYAMLTNGNYVGFRQYIDSAAAPAVWSIMFDYDAGAGPVTVDSLDYRPNLMRWWRIREASGTCYWDTSIDGLTWTNHASVAWPLSSKTVQVKAQIRATGALVPAGGSTFDNLNVPGTRPVQAISTLSDTFDTLDTTAKWNAFGGPPAVSSGQLHMPINTLDYAILDSQEYYELVEQSAHVEVVHANTTITGTETDFALWAVSSGHLSFWIYVDDASTNSVSISFAYRASGTTTPDFISIPYDPVAHRWLRFRNHAGNAYWDTSPDGGTWTNRRNVVWPLDQTIFQVEFYVSRIDPVSDDSIYDNFNVLSNIVYNDSASGTVIASGTKTETLTYDDSSSGTVTVGGSSVESYGGFFNDSRSGTITASVSVPASYAALVSSTPGLVSYWRLSDTSGAAVDETGLQAGTYNGSITRDEPSLLLGDSDTAARFPGSNGSYITIPHNAAYNTGMQLTVECWVKINVFITGVNQTFVGRFTPSVGWALQVTTRILRWYLRDNNSVDSIIDLSAFTPREGTTYHLVGVYDGAGTMKLYVNGVSLGAPNRTPNAATRTLTQQLTIGAESATASPLNGVVDDVSVYNVALTAQQVLDRYLAGAGPEGYSYTDSRTGTGTVSGTGTESYVFSDSGSSTATASGTVTESAVYADARTCPLAGSGTGVESYVVIPSVTFVSQSGTKISRVASQDAVNVVWSVDKNFTSYQFRIVSSPTAPVSAGVLLEQDQSPASGGTATTQYTSTITDDELVAAAGAEGSNLLKIFVQSSTGDWST